MKLFLIEKYSGFYIVSIIQKNIMNKDKHDYDTVAVIQIAFRERRNECHLIVFVNFPFLEAKLNVQMNILTFSSLLSCLPVTALKHNVGVETIS